MQFYLPASPGEWLAFASAIVTILFGLAALLAPRSVLRLWRVPATTPIPSSLVRGPIAGFWIGVAVCAVLFAQPFIYMALGAGWAFTALGCLVSMLAEKKPSVYNVLAVVIELVLAALPLAFVFGYG